MIVCAGNNEVFDFAHPIGVGLIESAINLTRLALFDKPDFLLFVGSAGSYGNHQIFDIVHSKTAANIELGFLQDYCFTPLNNVVSSASSAEVPRETIVNSSNYITTDTKLAQKMLSLHVELENMEFFSLLSVAKEFEIPAAGIFIITNYCDATAHEAFLKNHEQAKKILSEYLYKKEFR
ncbi:MAG: purine-nucleoside phosphorylase [Sulfurospirillum sp.]|nr:purine-nucleoside phosphorylase [Sulfurospirillum sp.]